MRSMNHANRIVCVCHSLMSLVCSLLVVVVVAVSVTTSRLTV